MLSALSLTVEQTEESILGPVGIVNLAKRGDRPISGRLLAPTDLGYQVETATPIDVGVLFEIKTRSAFFLGEVIRRAPQMHAWVLDVKIEHRIRRSECLLSRH